jgi:membrane protease YdiL (CAAX protease family)
MIGTMDLDQRVLPPWRPWEAAPVGLAALLASYLALVGVTALFGGQGGVATLVSAVLSQVAFAGFTIAWVAVRYPGTVPSLGLRSRRAARDLAMGAWIGAGMFAAAVFVVLPVIVVIWRFVAGSPPAPVDQGILTGDPAGVELVLGMFAVVVAAPIGEEIFFRGFLFGSLRARLGFARAAAISAAVFGVFHVVPLLIFVMFFVGFGLALIYERRGSLVAPMAAHAMFNIIGYTLLVMERT